MKKNVKIIISILSILLIAFLGFIWWWIGLEVTDIDISEIQKNIRKDINLTLIKLEINKPTKYYLQRTGFYNKYVILKLNFVDNKNILCIKKNKVFIRLFDVDTKYDIKNIHTITNVNDDKLTIADVVSV